MAKAKKQFSKLSIQREVLETLGSLKGLNILQLCDDGEATLLELSVKIVKQQLLSHSKQLTGDVPNDVVVIRGRPFQIAIHASPMTSTVPPDSLHLQILPILQGASRDEKPTFKASSKINGLGRYRAITVSAPNNLAVDCERIVQSVSFALETGYAWLAERISQILSEVQNATVDSLYAHIRTLLPRYAHVICLFLFREEKGIYIHDTLAARAWMQRAGRRSTRSTHSPIETVGRFTTEIIKLGESFSRIIHAEGKARNFPFVQAGYSHSGLQIAEMAIYESNTFVAQPLVTEEKFLLSAGYPVAYREQLEATLSAAKPKFRDILLNSRHELARMHQRIDAMRLLGRGGIRTAEWTGTFFGSGLGAYAKITAE